ATPAPESRPARCLELYHLRGAPRRSFLQGRFPPTPPCTSPSLIRGPALHLPTIASTCTLRWPLRVRPSRYVANAQMPTVAPKGSSGLARRGYRDLAFGNSQAAHRAIGRQWVLARQIVPTARIGKAATRREAAARRKRGHVRRGAGNRLQALAMGGPQHGRGEQSGGVGVGRR